MGPESMETRPVHDHLGRRPCRRQPRSVPRVPRRIAASTEFDEWRSAIQEPVPRPPGRRSHAQLGQRTSHPRARRRRRGGRGGLPEHDPAVLPHWIGDRPGARLRTSTSAGAWPGSTPTTDGSSSSARRLPPGASGLAQILLNDRRRRTRRRAVGQGSRPRRRAAARRLARHAVDRAAVLAALRPALGSCARSSSCRSPTTRAAAGIPNFGAPSGVDSGVRAGDRLLRQSRAVAPDDGRCLRAVPGPGAGDDRAGLRLGARRAAADGQPPRADESRTHRRARRPRRQRAVATAERVLRDELLHRRQLPVSDRHGAVRLDRHRPDHVGLRLPAPRGELSVHPRVAAVDVRRVRRSGPARDPRRHRSRGVRLRPRSLG